MAEERLAGQRTWVVGVGSLTRPQNRIVHLDTSRHHLVCGPAGSAIAIPSGSRRAVSESRAPTLTTGWETDRLDKRNSLD